jgi:hypothetical protein
MAKALLDIRIAATEENHKITFVLADVFHILPYQLQKITEGEINASEVLKELRKKCESKNISGWLNTAIDDYNDNNTLIKKEI